MTKFIPEELATALMCLGATVHDANKNPDEVATLSLLGEMVIASGHKVEDLIVWVNSEGEETVVRDLNIGGTIQYESTVETYKEFTDEQALEVKTVIEAVLAQPGLDPAMSGGVEKALERAFPQ